MLQSVFRSASAASIAAGLAVTALSAQSASAEQWVFERIVQTGDSLPFQAGVTIDDLTAGHIDAGNVVYSGLGLRNAAFEPFIAARINGINRTIAHGESPVPNGAGVFSELRLGDLQDTEIVFTGRDSSRGTNQTGVYRYKPASKLHPVADVSSNVPDLPAAAFTNFVQAFYDSDDIIYRARFQEGPDADFGAFRDANGTQSLELKPGDTLPDAANFEDLSDIEAENGALAAEILTMPGFNGRGIYRFHSGGDDRIAIEGELVIGGAGGEVFTDITPWSLNTNGEYVVFNGTGDMGANGLYYGDGAVHQILANTSTPAPPLFLSNFDEFMEHDTDSGNTVFTASVGPMPCGLFTNLGGSLKSVLDAGDMLDGKTVANISLSHQAISGNTIAMTIEFEDDSLAVYTATLTQESFETEPNNSIDTANCIELLSDCAFVSGKLQSNEFPACDPDTVLVAFDKQINFLEDESGIRLINDDDATEGDGRASALWDIPLVPGSGSSTIRLGVTGKADVIESNIGTAGDFNGLNQNFPHGQLGEFTLTVTFVDDMGMALPSPTMLPDGSMMENPIQYVDEFRTGGEAFYINYTAPIGADSAHAVIDNTTGRDDFCNDVDFFLFKNLIPLCPYCVVQIGGLNDQCTQTDGLLAWFSPKQLINTTDDNSGDGVYASLCDPDEAVTADVNGIIRIAFSGSGDTNFNGLLDGPAEDAYLADHPEYLNDYPGLPPAVAPIIDMGGQPLSSRALDLVCADPPPAHGECGCYTLKIMLDLDAHEEPPNVLVIQDAMYHGDINLDGITDTADLGILVGFFGWAAP